MKTLSVDIDNYSGACLPEEKVAFIRNLQEKDINVAMVGDRINDAPALAGANFLCFTRIPLNFSSIYHMSVIFARQR